MTRQELETLGLDNLIGTNVLRAYMHGYFMDIRLYKKAKLINEPFNFDEFKQRKIKEKIEKERENRVKISRKLPVVNTELAKRIIEQTEEEKLKQKKQQKSNALDDKRFAELFTDPNFQIDPNSDEFRLLNPVVQKANEKQLKPKKNAQSVEFQSDDDDDKDDQNEDEESESDSDRSGGSQSSSDDEHSWKKSVKEQYKQIQMEKRTKQRLEKANNSSNGKAPLSQQPTKQPKFFEIKDNTEFYKQSSGAKRPDSIIKNEKLKKLSLHARLQHAKNSIDQSANGKEDTVVFRSDSFGNKQMTFISRKDKREKDAQQKALQHHNERKGIRRSAGKIVKTLQKPNFFKKK